MRHISVGAVTIGEDSSLALIAGPCVIEDAEECFGIASHLKSLSQRLGIPFIFKASYDKANRTSAASYRGPGLEKGLEILSAIRDKLSIPVLTDVHCRFDVEAVARAVDVVQIPAFLCRQTDLVQAVAEKAQVVNVKKGQFLSPWEMKNVIEKIEAAGNRSIVITERGTSFGYNCLVSDMRAIPIMQSYGYPVIFDATHSVQRPGGLGHASGGDREFVSCLALAAVAAGCDGLFLEVHPEPGRALSDASSMLPLEELPELLEKAQAIRRIVRSRISAETEA
ncbi:MAG: 3-deoxy-8-phosphooctulonate synthase [bacterium]|nr:3-deoxy-8-phosphooctulonate synthase [bacterium]